MSTIPKPSSIPPAPWLPNPDFPFCSDGCRILDPGKWASGDYKTSSPIQDPDILEELFRFNSNRHSSASSGKSVSDGLCIHSDV